MADQTDILKNHAPLDPDRMFAELDEKLQQQVHPVDLNRIRSAYETAKAAHNGQKRNPLRRRGGHCGGHGA